MSNLLKTMSRIGKQPIKILEKVAVNFKDGRLVVNGPLGELEQTIRPEIKVEIKESQIVVSQKKKTRLARALHAHRESR